MELIVQVYVSYGADVALEGAVGDVVVLDVVLAVLVPADESWHVHREGWCWQTGGSSPWWR